MHLWLIVIREAQEKHAHVLASTLGEQNVASWWSGKCAQFEVLARATVKESCFIKSLRTCAARDRGGRLCMQRQSSAAWS